MTDEEKRILNKLKFLVEIGVKRELDKDKYRKYLDASYSCVHCIGRDRLRQPNDKCREIVKVTKTETGSWCFEWLKKENFVKKIKEKK